jgi:hypothetical protein
MHFNPIANRCQSSPATAKRRQVPSETLLPTERQPHPFTGMQVPGDLRSSLWTRSEGRATMGFSTEQGLTPFFEVAARNPVICFDAELDLDLSKHRLSQL